MKLDNMVELSCQKMTMEALRKAMRKLVENHVEHLMDVFEDETEDEIMDRVVDDIATDEVLNYINTHLKILPVVELEIEGTAIVDNVLEMECNIGHGINYIHKVFDKPVCLIGEYVGSYGTNDTYNCTTLCHSFLTVDGEWKFVEVNEIAEPYANSNENYFCLKMYQESDGEYYGLELLQDLIPDIYEYELYDFT